MAGLLKELWTGELLKHFRHENEFLGRIPSADQYVNNDAINLAEIGADPEVLIDNTVYPIPSDLRVDSDITIKLKKFDTTNTRIPDDELYALPYDKPGSAIEQHREVLEEKTAEAAIHSLAPTSNTTDTPVIETTGDSNGETYARKRLKIANIISLKKKLDKLKVPKKNRELVLCPDHVEDILLESQAFKDQYQNIQDGKVLKMYGFIISEFVANPVYSAGTKKAFGAAEAPATDQNASIAYYNRRAVKAKGTLNMYWKKAETDPENRESLIGFRLRHICIPKKTKGFSAIISGLV